MKVSNAWRSAAGPDQTATLNWNGASSAGMDVAMLVPSPQGRVVIDRVATANLSSAAVRIAAAVVWLSLLVVSDVTLPECGVTLPATSQTRSTVASLPGAMK